MHTSAVARDYLSLLRPTHWVKNVVVFAGPAAGLKLLSPASFLHAAIAFAAFCLASSGAYAINDALDRKADAGHPTKRHRPVASGAIGAGAALSIGLFLFVAALTIAAVLVNARVAAVLGAYFLLTLAYSLELKRRVILDVIVVATGFVLRTWAGSLAVDVATSQWLVACMFTLCLFMGFGKRRCEQAILGNTVEAGQHRRTLLRYTPDLLNHLITVSAGIAVVTFLLYTLDRAASPVPFPKEHLFYTLPIVVYGIFRFAMLTEAGTFSGPTEIVLKDRAMLGTILLWIVLALAIAYDRTLLGGEGIAVMFRRFFAGAS